MWKFCQGKSFCQVCRSFVPAAWLFFDKPAQWTQCVCEDCADQLVEA